jgi:hypothetical protein
MALLLARIVSLAAETSDGHPMLHFDKTFPTLARNAFNRA